MNGALGLAHTCSDLLPSRTEVTFPRLCVHVRPAPPLAPSVAASDRACASELAARSLPGPAPAGAEHGGSGSVSVRGACCGLTAWPPGRPSWGSRRLASAWSSAGCCGQLRSDPAHGRSVFLTKGLSLPGLQCSVRKAFTVLLAYFQTCGRQEGVTPRPGWRACRPPHRIITPARAVVLLPP